MKYVMVLVRWWTRRVNNGLICFRESDELVNHIFHQEIMIDYLSVFKDIFLLACGLNNRKQMLRFPRFLRELK